MDVVFILVSYVAGGVAFVQVWHAIRFFFIEAVIGVEISVIKRSFLGVLPLLSIFSKNLTTIVWYNGAIMPRPLTSSVKWSLRPELFGIMAGVLNNSVVSLYIWITFRSKKKQWLQKAHVSRTEFFVKLINDSLREVIFELTPAVFIILWGDEVGICVTIIIIIAFFFPREPQK